MSQVPVAADDSAVLNSLNSAIRELNNRDVTQLFKDDTGTYRVLLGKGSNGFNGLKVSQTGKDVTTATDSELVFNSDQNVFKIVDSGTIITTQFTTTNPGAGSFKAESSIVGTYTHNLGYVPVVIAFMGDSSSYSMLPFTDYTNSGGSQAWWWTMSVQANTTTIQVTVDVMSYGAGIAIASDYSIKFYLLQETAN